MTREEAIDIVRKNYPHVGVSGSKFETALRNLIPELRESEDERIRKELIEFIKWSVDRHFMREDFHQAKRPSEWIAYLKKQKTDHDNLTSMIKSLRPSWKPTKDQIKVLQWCKPLFYEPNCKKILESLIDDLQKLL